MPVLVGGVAALITGLSICHCISGGGVAALITGLSLCPCISGEGGGGCINYWTISLSLY